LSTRHLHAPTSDGVGGGRVVYLFWGFGGDPGAEAAACQEDVAALTGAGYTVVVDTAPGRRALREALYGQDLELEGSTTVAVGWRGDAARDGSLRLAGGAWVSPEDIEPGYVTHELEWVSFSRCAGSGHTDAWCGRVGERVTVRVEGEPERFPGELIRAALLPGGAGAGSVPVGEAWGDAGAGDDDGAAAGDAGGRERFVDAEEDTYWKELFELLAPERARAIEEGLGLSTRQFVWRVGELLASASILQLQGKREEAAEQCGTAEAVGSLLASRLPPLFEQSGDPMAAIRYLRETVPGSAFGRGALRLGADHDALLTISLQLLLLALSAEASDPIRKQLRAVSGATGLADEVWKVLDYKAQDLFGKAHQEVFAVLAAEQGPRHTSRALAFGLGRRLAVAVREGEGDAEWLTACKDMGDLLKVQVPDTLPRQGRFPELVAEIERTHGPDHASLFQLATQLMALRYGYDPMSPETVYRLSQRVKGARKKAGLEPSFFAPLKKVEQCTLGRSAGYDLVDGIVHAISERLLEVLD
jgi:hypothetical protein